MTDCMDNEDALRQFAHQAEEKLAAAYQVAIDKVQAEYAGRPVEDVKPALAAAWAAVNDESITDPELTVWAQAISDGKHIAIR